MSFTKINQFFLHRHEAKPQFPFQQPYFNFAPLNGPFNNIFSNQMTTKQAERFPNNNSDGMTPVTEEIITEERSLFDIVPCKNKIKKVNKKCRVTY